MTDTPPILHMLCGKIASGKSTLAADLARSDRTVLIVEDEWLHTLFADQLATGQDFLRCSGRLRDAMRGHVASLLDARLSVVLDFAANTVGQRRWMRSILDQTEAAHRLHVLDPPDALCLARLQARNAGGEHEFSVTEAQFHAFSRHFVLPSPDEGFTVVNHPVG